MGTWDVGILDDDVAADTYDQYLSLREASSEPATKIITDMYGSDKWDSREILDKSDDFGFWLAIAAAQAERGTVNPRLRQAVEYIITQDKDINAWKKRGGSEEDITARKAVLNKFLDEVTGKIKRKVKRHAKFSTGETVAYKHKDGSYIGLVAIDQVDDYENPYNRFLITDIKSSKSPSGHKFRKAKFLLSDGKQSGPLLKVVSGEKLQGSLKSVWAISIASSGLGKPIDLLKSKTNGEVRDISESDFLKIVNEAARPNLVWLPVRAIRPAFKEKFKTAVAFLPVVLVITIFVTFLALLLQLIKFIISLF